MPDPAATSQVCLKMYRFMGQLIGGAIRGQTAIPLDLSPTFWKLILGESLSLDDMKDFDTFSWQVLDGLSSKAEELSDEEFEAAVDSNFTTLLSNGTEVQLKPNGRNTRVTKQNLQEYLSLVIEKRLNETHL